MIVSWSPVHGQSATTCNVAAIASMFALDYQVRSLITHTQLTFSSLESLFGKELGSMRVEDGGMNALERLAKSGLLRPESIKDYTETIFVNSLDMLGGTKNQHMDQQLIDVLLQAAKEAYDVIWIDAHSGSRNKLTNRLISNADIVLVNLPQNRFVLDRFFSGEDFPTYLQGKEIILLISSYDKNSSFLIKTIKRRYKARYFICPVFYSREFKDAANRLALAEFFFRNQHREKQRGEGIFPFIQSIRAINQVISKKIGIKVNREDAEE